VPYFAVVPGSIGVAETLDGDELTGLIASIAGLSAVASVALLLISPFHAFMLASPVLRGTFSHKNMLGQVMAAGIVGPPRYPDRGQTKSSFGMSRYLMYCRWVYS
jgi:hypothetical protein